MQVECTWDTSGLLWGRPEYDRDFAWHCPESRIMVVAIRLLLGPGAVNPIEVARLGHCSLSDTICEIALAVAVAKHLCASWGGCDQQLGLCRTRTRSRVYKRLMHVVISELNDVCRESDSRSARARRLQRPAIEKIVGVNWIRVLTSTLG